MGELLLSRIQAKLPAVIQTNLSSTEPSNPWYTLNNQIDVNKTTSRRQPNPQSVPIFHKTAIPTTPITQAPIKEYKPLTPTAEPAPVNTAGAVAVAAAAGTVALT
jgi:hypothetical protein